MVKICEQAAWEVSSFFGAFFLQYGSLAGKAFLVLLAAGWGFYFIYHYVCKYRALNKGYSELQDNLEETKEEVNHLFLSALKTLTAALSARDERTVRHLESVAKYAVALGEQAEVPSPELSDLYCAALLHDLGKIGIPEAILNKPAKLSSEEFDVVRKHPEIATTILNDLIDSDLIPSIILHHHEFYDGSGYPSGLQREEIPLGARIIAIADAYDAMTSDRPYRSARPHNEAVAELIRCAGTQFDPRLVILFLDILEQEQEDALLTVDEYPLLHAPAHQLSSLLN